MSTQGRPNWRQAQPRQNDLKEIWIAGYGMTLVTEFNPELDVTDENTGVFGYSGTIDLKVINAGTITMAGIFDSTMQTLYDIASGVDPATTGIKGNVPSVAQLDIARLTKDSAKKYYEYVEIFSKTTFALPPPSGGPKERPAFNFPGRCDVPIGIRARTGYGLGVTWDVVALSSGATEMAGALDATIQGMLKQLPTVPAYENSGKYAMVVEVQKRTGATQPATISKSAFIPISDTTLEADGTVTITANDLLNTGIATTDGNCYAHIAVLVEVDTSDGLYHLVGDTIECRGRFDIPG